jgi:hypothetical protein
MQMYARYSLFHDTVPDENVIVMSIWVNDKVCHFIDYSNTTVYFMPLYNIIYLSLVIPAS